MKNNMYTFSSQHSVLQISKKKLRIPKLNKWNFERKFYVVNSYLEIYYRLNNCMYASVSCIKFGVLGTKSTWIFIFFTHTKNNFCGKWMLLYTNIHIHM